MIKNYILVALRSLQKNGFYSFINIAGLSIGIASSILILLWVNHELSWDNFHEKRDRISRVYISGMGDSEMYTQMAVPLPLWEEFKLNESGIKHVAPTNWGTTYLLSYGDQRLYKRGYYAGDDFLKIFSFELVKGSDKQLADPSTIVLTESAAASLFGDEEPIGKVIRVDDKNDMTVTGIVKDPPSNSTFIFDCLLPFTTYMNVEPWVKDCLTRWGNNSFNMYVEFDEGVDPQEVEARIKDVISKNAPDEDVVVTFLPMERWRLYSEFKNGKSTTGLIVYVRIFATIAVFILIIACINFTNLATARSEKRAREVGIRKSIGSRRKELIVQFMGETFLTAFASFIIAIGLVEVSLPFYNNLVGKELSINYNSPAWYAAAFGVVLVTGLLAGSYPALYLSSFQPAAVLKGRLQSGRRGAMPRKVLVTLQFFFSIFLIIATTVIYFQLNHLKNRPTGFDSHNLITVSATGEIRKNYEAIKNELLSRNLAASVTASSSPITAIYQFFGSVEWPGKRENQRRGIAAINVNYDYTKTMGIRVLKGRDFSPEFNDSTSILLNEAAVAYMGFGDPVGQEVRIRDEKYTVVGVLEDVVMLSPAGEIDPAMFLFDPNWINNVSIRLSSTAGPGAILPEVEEIFTKYNPNYPFTYRFTDQEFAMKFRNIERIGDLANVFSVLAILISCLGLFGLAAFTAEQRTKEIGIRKVLGATIANVVMLISRDFTILVIAAFILAAPFGAWIMNGWLSGYEYRIDLKWWFVFVAGGATFLLSLLVVSFQALKAAVANPANSLRNE